MGETHKEEGVSVCGRVERRDRWKVVDGVDMNSASLRLAE